MGDLPFSEEKQGGFDGGGSQGTTGRGEGREKCYWNILNERRKKLNFLKI